MYLHARYIYPFFLSSLLVGQGMLFSQVTSTWQVDGDGTWNVPGNWETNTLPPQQVVPQNVDDVAIFGNSNTQFSAQIGLGQPTITIGTLDVDNPNNIALEDSNTLVFQTSSGNAALNLTSLNGAGGSFSLALPATLNSNLVISTDSGVGETICNNVISGAGGITITGPQTISFASATGNTYTGTTTISGGNLSIDTGATSLQGAVVVTNAGFLTFNSNSSVGSLNIINGTVTGAITFPNSGNVLTMGGNGTGQMLNIVNLYFTDAGGATVTYDPTDGGTALITGGELNVTPDATYTFDIGSAGGAPDMELNCDFFPPFGSVSFIKTGAGVLLYDPPGVNGNNTGPTTVNQGTLEVNTQAQRGVPGDLTISGGMLLCRSADQISNSSNVTLGSGAFDFGGFAQTIGSFTFQSGTFSQGANPLVLTSAATTPSAALTMRNTTISGAINLQGDIVFDATNGGTATISGPLNIKTSAGAGTRTFTIGGTSANGMTISNVISNTGSTGIVKAGTGTLTFAGAGPNTYSGASTAVNSGMLVLNVTTGPAVPSSIVMISSGAAIDLRGLNQLSSGATVTVNGTLSLNGHNQTIAACPGASTGVIHLGSAQLTSGTSAFSFAGNIDGAGGSLFIPAGTGDKSYALTGTNSYTGTTTLSTSLPVSNISLTGTSNSLPADIINGTAAGTGSVIFDQTFNGTYPGNMTGTGSFTKQSSGILTMSGASAIDGPITVASGGGGLIVNGSLATTHVADITFPSGTLLGGNGTLAVPLGQAVIMQGTTSPGNSIGTLTINGNYVQDTGSTLEIEVSPSSADELIVTGNYQLNAGATLLIEPQPGIYFGSNTYTIVHSAGITGHGVFDTVTLTLPAFTGTVSYTPDDILLLEVGQASFSSLVTKGNAHAAAVCFDTLTPAPGSDLELVRAEIALLPTVSAIEDAFNLLQPSQFTALALAQEYATLYINDTIFHRLDQTTQTCKDLCPTDKKRTFWVTPFGALSYQQSHDHQPGFNTASGGVSTGVDYQICPNIIAGGALGYSAIDLSWKQSRGHASMQNGYGALYSSLGGRKAYLFGSFLGSYNYFHASRHIEFGTCRLDTDRSSRKKSSQRVSTRR